MVNRFYCWRDKSRRYIVIFIFVSGKKFAMLEMKSLMSGLIRRFRLEAVTKPSELKFRTDLVLRTNKQPIYVRFHKRSS